MRRLASRRLYGCLICSVRTVAAEQRVNAGASAHETREHGKRLEESVDEIVAASGEYDGIARILSAILGPITDPPCVTLGDCDAFDDDGDQKWDILSLLAIGGRLACYCPVALLPIHLAGVVGSRARKSWPSRRMGE